MQALPGPCSGCCRQLLTTCMAPLADWSALSTCSRTCTIAHHHLRQVESYSSCWRAMHVVGQHTLSQCGPHQPRKLMMYAKYQKGTLSKYNTAGCGDPCLQLIIFSYNNWLRDGLRNLAVQMARVSKQCMLFPKRHSRRQRSCKACQPFQGLHQAFGTAHISRCLENKLSLHIAT